MNNTLYLSKEVQRALADNRPLVALESTIISHLLLYPQCGFAILRIRHAVGDNGAFQGYNRGAHVAGNLDGGGIDDRDHKAGFPET